MPERIGQPEFRKSQLWLPSRRNSVCGHGLSFEGTLIGMGGAKSRRACSADSTIANSLAAWLLSATE